MKCEICHKAEAKTAVTCKKDGVEREFYVCETCADQLRKNGPTPPRKKNQPQITVIDGSKKNPPPFVEELMKATLGFMKSVAEAQENERQVCPVCKTKWEKIQESKKIGCPACWKTFARHIREEFLASQYGLSYQGSAPSIEKVSDADSARKILERDLQTAIAREDYLQAAELKRKLDDLQTNEGRTS